MTSFVIAAAVVVLSAALLILGAKLSERRKKYLRGLEDFMRKCKRYNASVLDVKDVPVDREGNTVSAVILQFRDEDRKSTIVHRYTESRGKDYHRGNEVELYYCDETDTACINGDNPFDRKARRLGFFAVLCRTAAALGIIAAILILIV